MHIPHWIPVFALWVAACGGERRGEPDPRYASYTQLSTSCGGGIAGTYAGTTVHRDGRVESWVDSASLPDGNRREERRADASTVAELFARVESIGVLDLPPGQPSNWCCNLTLSDPSDAFAVHWEGDPPGELRELVASILALGAAAPGK